MNSMMSLAIPFIVVALVCVGVDKLTLALIGILHKLPKVPDEYEWWFAYGLVLGMAYLFCWQGHFDLFLYLQVKFDYKWMGFLATALIISGGSKFVRLGFGVINEIPGVLTGMYSSFRSSFTPLPGSQTSAFQSSITNPTGSTTSTTPNATTQTPTGQPSGTTDGTNRYSENI